MRTRSLAVLASLASLACLAACASSPDPRPRGPEAAMHDGLGGWAVATLTDNNVIVGELIATAPDVYILARFRNHPPALVSRPRAAIAQLDVYPYVDGNADLESWGVVGTLSTIANGYFLVFTAPAWIATTVLGATFEGRSAHVRYPDKPWDELTKWARFPQGMPPGMITTQDLMPRLP